MFIFFIVVVKFYFDRDLIFFFDSIKKFIDIEFDINIVNEILCNSNDFVEINETINFCFVVQLLKISNSNNFVNLLEKF